ncbi:MAG TPA: hypothetical protein VGT40_00370 [Methylomirabilota bacterium]|jgi:hypothetical protein|nr:hypothetical protein [Methylomirabilota bacterium]
MTRTLSILVSIVTATFLLCATNARAQQDSSALTAAVPGVLDSKRVEGNVVEVAPAGERTVTVVRLDNNTDLIVAESTKAPGADVRVGAHVAADYVDSGNRKIATFLSAPEVQAP